MAVVIATSVTACSDSDKSGGPATGVVGSPITKAQFVARSNTFCEESRDEILERFAPYRREHNSDALSGKVFADSAEEFILPTLLFWYDDIISLDKPPGEEAEIEDILRTIQLTVTNSFEQRIYSVRQMSAMFNRSNRLMREYGIDKCIVNKAFFRS